jgi:hypothetical protein
VGKAKPRDEWDDRRLSGQGALLTGIGKDGNTPGTAPGTGNAIGDAGAAALAGALPHAPRLSALILCCMSHPSLLGAGGRLPKDSFSFRFFWVHAPITNSGVGMGSGSSRSDTAIGDAGVRAIAKAIQGIPDLVDLRLDGVPGRKRGFGATNGTHGGGCMSRRLTGRQRAHWPRGVGVAGGRAAPEQSRNGDLGRCAACNHVHGGGCPGLMDVSGGPVHGSFL